MSRHVDDVCFAFEAQVTNLDSFKLIKMDEFDAEFGDRDVMLKFDRSCVFYRENADDDLSCCRYGLCFYDIVCRSIER